MEQLLLELLLKLEPIWAYEPFNDRVSGGKMLASVFGLFIRPEPGYELPHDFGLSAEENRIIRDALQAYTEAARALAPALGINTFHKRLAAFQNDAVVTQREKLHYADIFGHTPPKQFDEEGNPIAEVVARLRGVGPSKSVEPVLLCQAELKVAGRAVRVPAPPDPTSADGTG